QTPSTASKRHPSRSARITIRSSAAKRLHSAGRWIVIHREQMRFETWWDLGLSADHNPRLGDQAPKSNKTVDCDPP
ncbi:MAG: hypothetical protein P8129_11040, partial [Anaerolineae bacterium]